MSSTWGNNLKLTLFGESHGPAIGVIMDGLPSGHAIDLEAIQDDLDRRAPGNPETGTLRQESDTFKILSGLYQKKTTGAPLCAMIENNGQHSADYEGDLILRPSHADYTGHVKYNGFNDPRGGGHFSGRLTAPLVLAGSLAKQYLTEDGIFCSGRISRLGDMLYPTKKDITAKISDLRQEGDSVGGIVECSIVGLPVGLGDPFFDSFESRLSALLFSIPGVKGVEFGDGFALASMKGSDANDPFIIEEDSIKTATNKNGGCLGGITTGMPVTFNVGFKPTASMGKPQPTVNLTTMEPTTLEIKGRHDPAIVVRALPVVEAIAAIVSLDFVLSERKLRK